MSEEYNQAGSYQRTEAEAASDSTPGSQAGQKTQNPSDPPESDRTSSKSSFPGQPGATAEEKQKQKVDRILAALYRLLSQLLQDQRRDFLSQDLTEAERRALESWIRAKKSMPTAHDTAGSSSLSTQLIPLPEESSSDDDEEEDHDDDSDSTFETRQSPTRCLQDLPACASEVNLGGEGASNDGSAEEDSDFLQSDVDECVLEQHDVVQGKREELNETHSFSQACAQKQSPSAPNTGSGSIRGVLRQVNRGRVYYRADVQTRSIRISSRQTHDLQKALEFLVVITALKLQLEVCIDTGCPTTNAEDLVAQIAQEHGIARAELGLAYHVRIRHRFLFGDWQMNTPVTHDLSRALGTWTLLNDLQLMGGSTLGSQTIRFKVFALGLAASWSTLKAQLLQPFQGHDTKISKVEAKLESSYLAASPRRLAAERQLEHWNRRAMAREERPQKKRRSTSRSVQEAVHLLLMRWRRCEAAALQQQERLLRLQRREAERLEQQARRLAQEERKARWRRMKRKDITMEEILGNKKSYPRSSLCFLMTLVIFFR
eukprot:TRINITY_DN3861_c0_g2_i6.p1 TRINITY_DN3861_c0_g2~~TRINITY_DN3861_c0_g2_i6.p1  ORF type:complete len:599 (-),score=106.00 TRINITY_DN3861_c0_g2_i6:5-1636(-)